MTKYQRLVLTVAIINLIVLAMFPPFADVPLAKNALPSFDGFYPLFSKLGIQPMHRELLTMETMLILINAMAAWLVLELHRKEDLQDYDHGRGIAIFAFINIAVMLLFPPFEQYNTLLRATAPSFDSFYFILGPRSARPIFSALLYIEVIFILINALAIYLLFNIVRRGEDAQRERLLEMADHMSTQDLSNLSETMRRMVEDHRARNLASLGRKTERRQAADPKYRGPERRKKNNRRTHR